MAIKPDEETLESEFGIYYVYSYDYSYEGEQVESDPGSFGAQSFGATVFGGDTATSSINLIYAGTSTSDVSLSLSTTRSLTNSYQSSASFSFTTSKNRQFVVSGSSNGTLSQALSRLRDFNLNANASGSLSVLIQIGSDLLLSLSPSSSANISKTLSKNRNITYTGESERLFNFDVDKTRTLTNDISSSGTLDAISTKLRNTTVFWNSTSESLINIQFIRGLDFLKLPPGGEGDASINTTKIRESTYSASSEGILDILGQRSKIFNFGLENTSNFDATQFRKRTFVYDGSSEGTVTIAIVTFDPDSDEIVRLVTRELPRSIVNERDIEWDIENGRRDLNIGE